MLTFNKKIDEVKRKSEQHLKRIRETFSSQLEDKLKTISKLNEQLKTLEKETSEKVCKINS